MDHQPSSTRLGGIDLELFSNIKYYIYNYVTSSFFFWRFHDIDTVIFVKDREQRILCGDDDITRILERIL